MLMGFVAGSRIALAEARMLHGHAWKRKLFASSSRIAKVPDFHSQVCARVPQIGMLMWFFEVTRSVGNTVIMIGQKL